MARIIESDDFVVRHALVKPSATPVPSPIIATATATSFRTRPEPPISTASLRDIIVSLLEENRHEDGVRFLTTVGIDSLIQDSKVISSLLSVFKPVQAIECDLKKRSTYLLQSMGMADVDHSHVWRVDSKRRRALSQSQQRVLMYLDSVNVQFVKPWFDDIYADAPSDFWDYLDELTAQPQKSLDQATDALELELYQNRMSLACILLKQMCADLASNLASARKSMFVKVVSEGSQSTDRIAYPSKLLTTICKHFDVISLRRGLLEEILLVRLLLDMTAAAAICDAVAKDNCVQALAKHLDDTDCFTSFIDLLDSDTLAVDIIDYALVSWYRFVAGGGVKWSQGAKNLIGMPPGAAKTAFCLRHVRPPSKKETPDEWLNVVRMLAKLVQRSASAYGRRLSHANSTLLLGASPSSEYPQTLLVATEGSDRANTVASFNELKLYLESKLPRPLEEDKLGDRASDKMECGNVSDDNNENSSEPDHSQADQLGLIYVELDLIEAFLDCSATDSVGAAV
ncbi:hypothetical protein EV174_001901 [Coemansia sp. RSA 2320]|nr:hypothetical protein EV174_001901 [Coemansia sp. RSA 2320]